MMISKWIAALVLGAALTPASADAQQAPAITQAIGGTRLDVTATGEVTRVPDVAVISAGVVSRAATATGALQDASARMQRVLGALKRAGVADRDIQTSNVSLNPEYRYPQNQAPQLTGYTASNSVTVRFREIGRSGTVLDALVGQGANQISGPNLLVDKPDAALDEARAKAIAVGRARADLYARSLGLRVARVVVVSENSSETPPMPMVRMAASADAAQTRIEPGEQKLQVTLMMTFELQ
jgi:uncharacterized protein